MKKKAYVKNQIRTILKTKTRFMSIFIIVFLGASCFMGLRSTPSLMRNTMDSYYSKYNGNDIEYIGTLAFSTDDINKIKDIDGIKDISYGLRFDALMTYQDEKAVGAIVYTSSFNDKVNKFNIFKGRKPTKDNECIFDAHYAEFHHFKLNDKISVKSNYGKKEYTIVGLANDVRYFCNTERGTNSLGDGSNECIISIMTSGNEKMALPQEVYDLRGDTVLYNDLQVTVENPSHYSIFSSDYEKYVSKIDKKITKVLKNNYSKENKDLTSNINQQIKEGTDKYQTGFNQYQDGLKKYNDGLALYNQGNLDYNNGLNKYNTGYKQYQQGLNTYNTNYQKYLSGLNQYNQGISQYNKLVEALDFLKNNQTNYNNAVATLPSLEALYATTPTDALLQQINSLKALISSYEQVSNQMISTYGSIANANTFAMQTKGKLASTKQTLDQSKIQLDSAKKTLNSTLVTLNESKKKLNTAKQTLNTTKTTLDNSKIQLDQAKVELDQANIEIEQAKNKIKDIPTGSVYSLTSKENASLISYDMNCDSIAALSLLFPTIFFLVSALVSMTTMTRMVEEFRLQSGSLRSLGYTKRDVIRQYIIYAFLATFFASVIGIIAGTYFFPTIIYYLYSFMMYTTNYWIVTSFDLSIVLQTLFISVGITVIVTYLVTRQELNSTPAVLLRPKAPRIGKRILLEKITFIWKRLSFIQKVTMRNIFRYKKRFMMSIIGIAGCTALIITGIGIKLSVSPLVSLEYGSVFTYDGSISYDDDLSQKQIDLLTKDFNNLDYIKGSTNTYNKTISIQDGKYGTLVVPEDTKKIRKYVNIQEFNGNKELTIQDDGVIINAKLSELLDVKVGDKISITLNNKKYKVKVSGIGVFYFQHFIYMSPTYYQSLTNEKPKYNVGYFNLVKNSKKNLAKIDDYVKKTSGVDSTSYLAGLSKTFDDKMSSLNSVVIILITMAAILNFVVLYNLTNINIQERKSEIATIKLLGFHNKEVYDYVFRENYILAIIGSILGIVLGTIIHHYVIISVEVEVAMFIRSVKPVVYLIAIILTIIFTIIINQIMKRVLRHIDMVESLKSIE